MYTKIVLNAFVFRKEMIELNTVSKGRSSLKRKATTTRRCIARMRCYVIFCARASKPVRPRVESKSTSGRTIYGHTYQTAGKCKQLTEVKALHRKQDVFPVHAI